MICDRIKIYQSLQTLEGNQGSLKDMRLKIKYS